MSSIAQPELLGADDSGAHGRTRWDVLLRNRPNVLLEGPHDTTESTVRLLMPYLFEPLQRFPRDTSQRETVSRSTLILRGVDTLNADGQARLHDWLDGAPGRAQVVSTSRCALFELVTHRRFDERLYYRLNTILVQLRTHS